MAGFVENLEDSLLQTSLKTQILIGDLFKEILESFTSVIVERIEGLFKKDFIQVRNKETSEGIISELQMPNNCELQNEEVKEIQFNIPPGNGMDVFQTKKERLRGLKERNQEILSEISPKALLQSIGKLSGGVGILNIRKKIRSGTLQFLYKNGFLIAVKEMCSLKGTILRREQDEGGGIRLKKKVRKKVRKKWRWKNYKLFVGGG